MLFQLQRLFGSLERSSRQAYDPTPYCRVFKDPTGASVDVQQQMDAQQYMLAVFDKLAGSDGELLSTSDPTLVDDVVRAGVLNQMMCQGGCGTLVEREEVYYSLPLEVKNMKNVNESLNKLISEEDVADFYCEACQKKVPLMKKRLVLNKLPPVVILQVRSPCFLAAQLLFARVRLLMFTLYTFMRAVQPICVQF